MSQQFPYWVDNLNIFSLVSFHFNAFQYYFTCGALSLFQVMAVSYGAS